MNEPSARSDETLTLQEAADKYNIPVARLKAYVIEGRISPVYARTLPQEKELGLPPKDSSENAELYRIGDLERLKLEIEAEE
jgi:hypothetical protein